MNRWILRDADPAGGGGGGGEGGEGAAAFDWDAPLPSGEHLPDVYKPYEGKTFNDVVGAHKELRTELNNRAGKITGLNKDLETTRGELTALQEEHQLTEDQKRTQETRALWSSSLEHYYDNETADEEMLVRVMEATALSRQEVLDVHENFLQRRQTFLGKAAEAHEDIDVPTLERWVKGGDSPFTLPQLEAFYWMADQGFVGWLPLVQDHYTKFLEGGGTAPGQPPAASAVARGRPGAPPSQGYKSRAEYQREYAAARHGGDPIKLKEVLDKLEQSDKSGW